MAKTYFHVFARKRRDPISDYFHEASRDTRDDANDDAADLRNHGYYVKIVKSAADPIQLLRALNSALAGYPLAVREG